MTHATTVAVCCSVLQCVIVCCSVMTDRLYIHDKQNDCLRLSDGWDPLWQYVEVTTVTFWELGERLAWGVQIDDKGQ